jgi:hypothetical protein
MRGSFCYMPVLPARFGAFRALAGLSPIAKSRTAPLFDIPNVLLTEGQTLDRYLARRVEGIYDSWATQRVLHRCS